MSHNNSNNNTNKAYHTALIVQPPKDLWDQIQSIRSKYDKAYERWMPHINMAFPFAPDSELEVSAEVLRKSLTEFSPFTVKFSTFKYFAHSKTSHTLWLSPETADEGVLQRLQSEIAKALPSYNDLALRENGFVPHLTVGQFKSLKHTEQMAKNFGSSFQPIEFLVTEIYVIRREKTTPFEIVHTIKLGGQPASS